MSKKRALYCFVHVLAAGFLAFLPGCTFTYPVKYELSDISARVRLDGGEYRLGSVQYLPADSGQMAPTQIACSGLPGHCHNHNFDQPMTEVVRNALTSELQAAGAKESGQGRNIIQVEIVEVLAEQRGLGYGGWRPYFHMRVQVKKSSGAVVYTRDFGRMTKTPGATTGWVEDIMVVMREAMSTLIADPDFGVALKGR
jgi:hypothetical protein